MLAVNIDACRDLGELDACAVELSPAYYADYERVVAKHKGQEIESAGLSTLEQHEELKVLYLQLQGSNLQPEELENVPTELAASLISKMRSSRAKRIKMVRELGEGILTHPDLHASRPKWTTLPITARAGHTTPADNAEFRRIADKHEAEIEANRARVEGRTVSPYIEPIIVPATGEQRTELSRLYLELQDQVLSTEDLDGVSVDFADQLIEKLSEDLKCRLQLLAEQEAMAA